jgi:hypothetical protein
MSTLDDVLRRSAGLQLCWLSAASPAVRPMVVKGFSLLYLFVGSVAFTPCRNFQPSMHRLSLGSFIDSSCPTLSQAGTGFTRLSSCGKVSIMPLISHYPFVSVVIMQLAAGDRISAISIFLVFIQLLNLALRPHDRQPRNPEACLSSLRVGVPAETSLHCLY